MTQQCRDPSTKVLGRGDLVSRFGRPRTETLIFTNGCFDLLHWGHAAYLRQARGLGDVLAVGINSDRSVRALKGRGRPLMSEQDRGLLLASLEFVDVVTVFDEATPEQLLAELLPDVLVKGSDYGLHEIAGREVVEEAGGRVLTIPLLPGRSTSSLITRIQEGRAIALAPDSTGEERP